MIALLNIGSELLTGRTVNTNATDIARILRKHGFELETVATCHDERLAIQDWLDHLLTGHDLVLITGGLGPTKDDITKTVLKDRFGGDWVTHEPTLNQIRKYLESRNRPLIESNRLQAQVPSSCTVLPNAYGTAPGMAFEENGKSIISLPGVPFEVRLLMENQVVPWFKKRVGQFAMHSRIVRTAGIPEARLGEKMQELVSQFPEDLSVAYLPDYDGTKIELRLMTNLGQAEKGALAIDRAQNLVASHFSKYVYALEDLKPNQVLANLMRERNLTMGTAESCTGGAIAASMVEISGISQWFKGGVVAYMNEVKKNILGVAKETIAEKGVVSAEVAMEMAIGAKKILNCDFTLSITGITEAAQDAVLEDQPQCWIGFADEQGATAIHVMLFQQRFQNIQVATHAAILYAIRRLKA